MSFFTVSIQITKQLLRSGMWLLCSALSSGGLSPSVLCHHPHALPAHSITSWQIQTKLDHSTHSTSTARFWTCGLNIFIIIIIIIYHGSSSRFARSWPARAHHPKVMLIMDSPCLPKVNFPLFCSQHNILFIFWLSLPANSSVGAALLPLLCCRLIFSHLIVECFSSSDKIPGFTVYRQYFMLKPSGPCVCLDRKAWNAQLSAWKTPNLTSVTVPSVRRVCMWQYTATRVRVSRSVSGWVWM